jgi:hypothetical protein
VEEPVLFDKIYSQGLQIIDSFQLKDILTNDVFGIHITAAQGYLMKQKKEKAMDALERYVDTVCRIKFPIRFKGNEYFNQVAEWFEDNNCIGTNTPIDDMTIKKNFVDTVAENPAFSPLKGDERYNLLVEKLKGKLGGTDGCHKYRKS